MRYTEAPIEEIYIQRPGREITATGSAEAVTSYHYREHALVAGNEAAVASKKTIGESHHLAERTEKWDLDDGPENRVRRSLVLPRRTTTERLGTVRRCRSFVGGTAAAGGILSQGYNDTSDCGEQQPYTSAAPTTLLAGRNAMVREPSMIVSNDRHRRGSVNDLPSPTPLPQQRRPSISASVANARSRSRSRRRQSVNDVAPPPSSPQQVISNNGGSATRSNEPSAIVSNNIRHRRRSIAGIPSPPTSPQQQQQPAMSEAVAKARSRSRSRRRQSIEVLPPQQHSNSNPNSCSTGISAPRSTPRRSYSTPSSDDGVDPATVSGPRRPLRTAVPPRRSNSTPYSHHKPVETAPNAIAGSGSQPHDHHYPKNYDPEPQAQAPAQAPAQATYMEIQPGLVAPLRGSQETVDAVHRNYITKQSCLSCSVELYCIADAQYLLCPICRVVNPIFERTEFPTGMMNNCHGVGMGFTRDTLLEM